MKKYKTIVVDPPWKYGNWCKASNRSPVKNDFDRPLPFKYMTIEEIKNLRIDKIAAVNCDLYLWTTQKYLPTAFDILHVWGFKYCQSLVWCKKPRGIGQGGLFCPTTEFLLLSRKGRMPKNKRRVETTWWQVKRQRRHSKKPEFFQDIIERVSDKPRIELFARRKRCGLDVWGDEVKSTINIKL